MAFLLSYNVCILAILVLFHVSTVIVAKDNNAQTPKFYENETYQDIFPLTNQNFTKKVLKSEDAWVIFFHSGTLKRSWKSMAVSLRGVVSFGMIDIHDQPELVGKLNHDFKNGKEARVYPYGSKSIKEKNMIDTSSPNEAKQKATESIPNYILDVKNMGVEDFIVDSFMSTPSRFPLLIFTESKEISALYKVLALKFERYFNFGHMVNPSISDLQSLGIQDIYLDMPSVLVLTTDSPDLSDPKFNAIQYKKSSLGDLTYPNVFKFLVNINKQHRHNLPGENMSNNKEDMEMSEVIKSNSDKFDITEEHVVHTNIISDMKEIIVDDGEGIRLTDEL